MYYYYFFSMEYIVFRRCIILFIYNKEYKYIDKNIRTCIGNVYIFPRAEASLVYTIFGGM